MIASSIVYLREPFIEGHSSDVHGILIELCDEVRPTKKGKHWEVVKNNNLFFVDVESTQSRLHDCEDDLLELNLLPEDAPELVAITSNNLRSAADANFDFVELLSKRIEVKLGGLTSGTSYCH